jgi:hypothetical protein
MGYTRSAFVDATGVAVGLVEVLEASSPPLGALVIKNNMTQAKPAIINKCFVFSPPLISLLCENPF